MDEQTLTAHFLSQQAKLKASLGNGVGERIETGNGSTFIPEVCIAQHNFYSSQLSAVEEVLSKLSAGTVSLCSDCSQEIEPERLSLMFETGKPINSCISCQQLRDRGGKLIPFKK